MNMQTKFRLALFSPFEVPKLLLARLMCRRFGLAAYQANYLYLANQLLSLKGKRVLEVGGSMPREIVIGYYKCDQWVCVDDYQRYAQEVNFQSADRQNCGDVNWSYIDGRIEDIPSDFEGRFDIIFSTAVLEHINDLPDALMKMKGALAPGGKMFHSVGPIWSGPNGHHFFPSYLSEFGEDAGDRVAAELRPWMHLCMTPEEMLEHLHSRLGSTSLSEAAVYSIYQSPRINRLTFDNYLKAFDGAGLAPMWVHRWVKKQQDRHFLKKLQQINGDCQNNLFNAFSTVLAPAP